MRSFLLLALLWGSLCLAEDIDPQKAVAIKKLLEITGAQANRQELTRTFTQQLKDKILQAKMYKIYARYFTLEDIEGLIEFNETPIGIKANRIMPILMQESINAAQQWSEEVGPIMSDRVMKRLKAEGVLIGH